MFELTRRSAHVPSKEIDVGDTFEYEGEHFLRLDAPKKIGEVDLPLTKSDVVAASLSTLNCLFLMELKR